MRFQEAYEGWAEGRLSQAEAAQLLGQCERSLRRHIERYEADGLDGLLDRRLSQVSKRRATGEHTSMFMCHQEGTASSFHGIGQTIARYGLFASLYSDRGSHYFTTPEAGGKVNLTEVGRALKQLGIDHIAAYSPEARGRSERAFQTHQGRLPQELARAGITDMDSANRYLEQVYRPGHNREFAVPSTLAGTAYVPFLNGSLPDILCEQHERTVGNDNCVSFAGLSLQIPADELRYHYVRARVRVHRYVDATLAVFHGPRKLAAYDAKGVPATTKEVLRLAA